MDVLNHPALERPDYYDYNSPERVLERKVKAMQAKAEREFFNNPRWTHWDYEERLTKIDQFVKIWKKRNAE